MARNQKIKDERMAVTEGVYMGEEEEGAEPGLAAPEVAVAKEVDVKDMEDEDTDTTPDKTLTGTSTGSLRSLRGR